MFTLEDMRKLLQPRPFVPFRLRLTDGGSVEVRSPEFAMLGRRFVIVGLPDPKTTDKLVDRWLTIWYLHVVAAEQIDPGAPPFTSSPRSTPSDTPAPA
jgi:hypothetical protein